MTGSDLTMFRKNPDSLKSLIQSKQAEPSNTDPCANHIHAGRGDDR